MGDHWLRSRVETQYFRGLESELRPRRSRYLLVSSYVAAYTASGSSVFGQFQSLVSDSMCVLLAYTHGIAGLLGSDKSLIAGLAEP